jgi:hypothetical protein
MNARTTIAGGLWAIGIAAVATIFYLAVTRHFLIGAVEFGTLLAGGGLLLLAILVGVLSRRILQKVLLSPRPRDLVAGSVFVVILAATASVAAQFPNFPWPAGVLAAVLVTGGTVAALSVREEMRTGKWRPEAHASRHT